MIRRPPRSTLFPYTRSSDLSPAAEPPVVSMQVAGLKQPAEILEDQWGRSEEHTSELQSQSNLVCRLLLEKKKPCSWNCHFDDTFPPPPTHKTVPFLTIAAAE